MPYETAKSGSGYVLRKKHGGKVMGRHKSKRQAERQRRAIYMSEHGKARNQRKFGR